MGRAPRGGPTSPRPPFSAGESIAPGYPVLTHLCRTGWLDVYDCWSEERDCRCVVKVVRPDRRRERRLRERLLREGRWLTEFTHPHLVRGYGTGERPQPYAVQETLTGETLAHLLDTGPRRPAATDLALLGLHVCSATHYLHGQGLLHLDLKPSNIVIDCRHAKVLDLSIARPPGPGTPGIGTDGYLAPEQASGGLLTSATDVWGIGITLYEAATGELPFGDVPSGDEPVSPAPPIAPAPPVSRSRRLPRSLAAAIDACLRLAPEERPTLPELAEALDRLLPQGRRAVPAPEDGEG
ncbi:serine/threonine protein kinase [Streptomyces sp. 1114.5]|uniref:serine/threonine-protein kinase n=1 Tax=Streptomyces sp. 1114.5 TaxID=1938830 RepID=UPI000EB151F7|nr:serine/threonine-protein kinase [Streptomyces sp. 1114.5]RKT17204.1 serine/threonine protein kinase [Streptomyces sp. 1114.5]